MALTLGCGAAKGEPTEPEATPEDGDTTETASNGGQQAGGSSTPADQPTVEAADDKSSTTTAGKPANGGKATGKAKPKPASKFEPKTPRDKIAKFLLKPATDALKARDYGRAIPIFRAIVTVLGEGDKAQYELATAWILAGKQRQALDALEVFINNTSDAALKKKAKLQYKRQRRRKVRFGDENFRLKSSPRLAKQAFDRGRKAFRAKHYADALVNYRMGSALAPDAAGFLREIGATYAKLGARNEQIKWYVSYLRERPFGKNADMIRKELRKEKKALGVVNINSPFKCQYFLIDQIEAPKPPVKKLKMAPGEYTLFCGDEKYAMGYWENFKVHAGQTTNVKLSWAVLVNGLKDPYGRIIVENAREPGVMMDLGIAKTEVGIYVPKDRRALKVILKADDESRVEERFIRVEPGAKEVVKW
jgi:tetratricopeptide (TPR) repeat protein